jgi:hypothetical protein
MPQPARIARLDGREEIGDSKAPPGSLGWVRSLRFQTNQLKRDARMSALLLKGSLEALLKEDHWRQLVDEDGRPWSAWEWFCQHHEPWGLGMSPEQVAAILAETDPNKTIGAVLGRHGGDHKSKQAKVDQPSRRRLIYGDNEKYAEARLRRDAGKGDAKAADAVGRVEHGELGWREAAHEAGIFKRRSGFKALCSAWKRALPEEQDEFEKWIAEFRRKTA